MEERETVRGRKFNVITVYNPDTAEKVDLYLGESCVVPQELKQGDLCSIDLTIEQNGFRLMVTAVCVSGGVQNEG